MRYRAESRGHRGRDHYSPRQPQWRYKSRLAKAGYVAGSFVTALVVVASLGAYAEYRHLTGNISAVKVTGLSHRSVYGAQNILLLGSQTRKGKAFGSNPSLNTSNSDNLLLVHLDPTHTHAIILSIPRDTIVYEPGCRARPPVGEGIWGPYQAAIIDGAMNIGGPSCAVKTVEDFSGVKLDHFVMFDFNSFRAMVDAIGGVEVCVPPGGYRDRWSGLRLSGGKHLLSYDQALAYVRTRLGRRGRRRRPAAHHAAAGVHLLDRAEGQQPGHPGQRLAAAQDRRHSHQGAHRGPGPGLGSRAARRGRYVPVVLGHQPEQPRVRPGPQCWCQHLLRPAPGQPQFRQPPVTRWPGDPMARDPVTRWSREPA